LPEAQTALVRADARVAGGGPAELLRRVRQMHGGLTLAGQLEQVRLKAATRVEGTFDVALADPEYAALFRGQGLAEEGEDPAAVAGRIQGSAVRAQLVAALDDWANVTADPRRRAWLLAAARRADPGDWGDRFRDPAVWGQREALERLAREAQVAELSPQLLRALGQALWGAGADPVPLMRAAQKRHPADFWLNFDLGNALRAGGRPEEAVGYYLAALEVRPGTGGVYNNLGLALRAQGDLAGAVACFRRAIDLDPKLAGPYHNLGLALGQKRDWAGAADAFRQAIALDPKHAQAYSDLGDVLRRQRDLGGAIAACRRAIKINPKLAQAHCNLGHALADQGRTDDAIQADRTAIALDPSYARAHTGLGRVLLDKGRPDEAIRHFSRAIELDPKDVWAHNNWGLALYRKGQADKAIPHFRRAIDLDPKEALPHTNLGFALQAQGRLDDALQAHRRALALDPKLAQAYWAWAVALYERGDRAAAVAALRKATKVDPYYAPAHEALGTALLLQGQFAEARAATRRCLDLLPRNAPQRQPLSQRLRQCEQGLELSERLPAILRGDDRPRDAEEQLALADLCRQHKQRYAAAARFYAAAFADQPRLADDKKNEHRYHAAGTAALAAVGQGQDTGRLEAGERARLRRQALDWLRADLARWAETVDKGPPEGRAAVAQTLRHWQTDPDLAGLRDAAQLAQLPQAEREACLKLWADVEALLQRAQENQ
jgi:tetratricopeptide (TPR) repeat protein